MDLLKAAISSEVRKRKSLIERATKDDGTEDSGSSGKRRKKYVRVADLEKAAQAEKASSADKRKAKETAGTSTLSSSSKSKPEASLETQAIAQDADADDADQPANVMADDEVVKRLRARGEPIRLFGEGSGERRKRLRHLELSEEKTDGQQNEFRRVMAQVEAGAMLDDLHRQANMTLDSDDHWRQKYQRTLDYDVSGISPELLRTDIDRLHTLLYVYFKRLVYEWREWLDARPEDERHSAEGKMAAATQRQAAEYLRPLFRSLKARKLPADVLARVTEIARFMMDREYMRANDAYLQLSIGNAPWPLGVTQVGIHARAARENINANKVAHVLNDETQRKWIQSVKRLIRFAQTKYPPDDLAKMAG
ncbi:hypothetical protein GGI15_000837 [Coemansia interrupta]|uniref:Pre-mRNA-splicing factor 18 n=1 Tax=Coemansia interrupta TaxID=1126814 RepID=A0A9W8HKK0_9FUNG|nr:hypothetical protein GGI15_000837 [Coemansia interrupta]